MDPDYSVHLAKIAAELSSIATTFSGYREDQKAFGDAVIVQLKALNVTEASSLTEQVRFVEHAVNTALGIVMRANGDPLARATTLAALSATGGLERVIAEMNSPTPLPGGV